MRKVKFYLLGLGVTLLALPFNACVSEAVDGVVQAWQPCDVFNCQDPNYFDPCMFFNCDRTPREAEED